MKINIHSRSCQNQNGAVLVGSVLLIPILLMIGYFCYEFATTISTYQRLASVSREVARDASFCMRSANDDDEAVACIQNDVIPNSNRYASFVVPQAEIVVKLFRLKAGSRNQLVQVATGGLVKKFDDDGNEYEATNLGDHRSRFTVERLQSLLFPDGQEPGLTSERPYVAVSELFVKRTVTSPTSYALGHDPGLLYETTLF